MENGGLTNDRRTQAGAYTKPIFKALRLIHVGDQFNHDEEKVDVKGKVFIYHLSIQYLRNTGVNNSYIYERRNILS